MRGKPSRLSAVIIAFGVLLFILLSKSVITLDQFRVGIAVILSGQLIMTLVKSGNPFTRLLSKWEKGFGHKLQVGAMLVVFISLVVQFSVLTPVVDNSFAKGGLVISVAAVAVWFSVPIINHYGHLPSV
jgi:hypothetical protein